MQVPWAGTARRVKALEDRVKALEARLGCVQPDQAAESQAIADQPYGDMSSGTAMEEPE